MKSIAEKIFENNIMSYNAMLAEFVKTMVCSFYQIDTKVLNSNNRKREVVKCRQTVMYILKKNSGMSLSTIGRLFNKNHATVLHAIRAINDEMFWNKELCKELEELEQIVVYKSKTLVDSFSIDSNFYYIDLNAFWSVKSLDKAIIMVGYNEEEAKLVTEKLGIKTPVRNHNNKGLYILEKNEDEKEHNQDKSLL